jgi:hypothetical protein
MITGIATRVGLASAILALPIQAAAQGQTDALLAADRAASELSSDSGIARSLARNLEPGGVLLWPGAPVAVGAAEAGRLLGAMRAQDSIRLTWQPLSLSLARDSSLGVTWGIAAVSSRDSPSPPQLGRYIAAWKRQTQQWTLDAILFVAVKPPATPRPQAMALTRSPATPTGPAAAFVKADLAFARLAGDSGAAAAFRHWAASEAMVFGEHALLRRGPAEIGRGVEGPASWRWHPVAAGAAAGGDLGWTVGEALIKPAEGEPVYSKYLTIWIRRSDGSVRFLTDGGNSRPATP